MSPLLKTVEKAGIEGLFKKRNPHHILPGDFFETAEEVRALFGKLVNVEAARVALVPAVSYGMGVIMQNCKPLKGQKIITIHEEFPSDVYSIQRISKEYGTELVTIEPPRENHERGQRWNERILEAISPGTALVNLSSVHWADGTIFDLEKIGNRAKDVGALFVVDGTQSVGAMPLDVKRLKIDALLCSGYKWLLGPYTSGLAYFGEYFDEGKPLEETWLNRAGSENFQALVNYQPEYKEKAARYNMGEYSNFINLPMLKAALTQILYWSPATIQDYCNDLMTPLINYLGENGFWIEENNYRASHIFGFRLPAHLTMEKVKQQLTQKNIIVSLRGDAVRLSPHVYNNSIDIQVLIDALNQK